LTAVADSPGEPAAPDRGEANVSSGDLHLEILQAFVQHQRAGAGTQPPRRALEQRVRRRVLELVARLTDLGVELDEAADRLGVSVRTLHHWAAVDRAGTEASPFLGRPRAEAAPEQQVAVGAYLDGNGPGVGVPTLRSAFPDLARVVLDELLQRYRQRWRAQHPRLLHVLHWQRPGLVWAMDFAEAPSLIDGMYPYLLAVRDLASGKQLLWRAVPAATAEVVRAELHWLFLTFGAPWVMKSDNGPPFRADDTKQFLQGWGVDMLFSPPRTPSYNGSIEAAIGSLKTRTQRLAVAAGHPAVWTMAVVEAARQQANASRPRRLHGARPDEVWEARQPWTVEERARWQATVAHSRADAWSEKAPLPTAPVDHWTEAAVDRVALRRALVAHDLLWFRRRRIPAQIKRPKTAIRG
jgi:transposase InsO family protein